MDYNKIKTFITVAELGSITRAAHQMRRSQSAISQQIQLLEEELELNLLERKAGKVYLSKHGEEILDLARSRLSGIDEGILGLKHATRNIEGQIRLGILNDYGNDINYGTLIGKFCQKYPNISLELTEGTSSSLEAMLLRNEIDLSFQVYFQMPEMVHQISVTKASHSLYTSKKYNEEKGPFRSYKQLIEADLIDITEDFVCIGTYFKKNAPKLAPSLRHRRPNIAVPNHNVMHQVICSGYGIAIMPDYFVADDLKKGKIVNLMPSSKPVYAGLDLAYRTNKTLRLAERIFLEYTKSFYKKS